jgi:hypothetical protein
MIPALRSVLLVHTWSLFIGTNGCADTCQATLESIVCGQEFCSLTQGAYGNANGMFNGMRRLQLIQSLLSSGPLVVGKPGRSLTIPYASASCIIQRLPAGSGPVALPSALGDATLNSSTCETSPTLLPLQNGRFKNVLLGQVITLSLNVRLECDLGDFQFCPEFDVTGGSNALMACHVLETKFRIQVRDRPSLPRQMSWSLLQTWDCRPP